MPTTKEGGKQKAKLVKYLRGTAKAITQLAKEVDEHGFDKENEELMSKIGSDMLFNAKTYTYLSDE